MTKILLTSLILMLPLAIAGCDRGPYDAAAHRQEDASTGSHLSSADTGVDPNGAANNPSLLSNGSTMGSK